MGQWRVLVPVGIAFALWALGIVRLDAPHDIALPVAASSPCRPTAAEVAATDVALAALPTTTATPTIATPLVTTELVVLAEDRDVPQLVPSLIIRAPATDQPAINKLLSTNLTEIDADDPATPVPFELRQDRNAYRTLLVKLLTNEDDAIERDEIGLLTAGTSTLLGDALGIRDPPLVGVGRNGTVTLVIPQMPRPLADNNEAVAGGWTVTSSGRDVTFLFDGQPEAKTAWDVRVCTEGLPIVSTSLIAPITPRRSPTATVASPIPNSTSPQAPESHLVFQNPNNVHWSFPAGMEPTAVKVTTQAPVLSAFRMWLFTNPRQNVATALALLLPAGLLLVGAWLGRRSNVATPEAEGARARLDVTSRAVFRLAITAALFPFVNQILRTSRDWDSLISEHLLGGQTLPALLPGSILPVGFPVTLSVLAGVALVILGLLDHRRPRIEGARQFAEEIGLGLIVVVVVISCFSYFAAIPPRHQPRIINPAMLIVGYMMFLASAVRLWSERGPTLGRWPAMALPAIGAVSLLLCTLRWEIEKRLIEDPFIAGGILPIWVTVCVVAGFVMLTIALLRGTPLREGWHRSGIESERSESRNIGLRKTLVRLTAGLGVALVIAAILVQWAWAIYSKQNIWWRAAVEVDPLTNVVGIADAELARELLNYPITFFVSVVEILIILGLIGIVAVLRATEQPLVVQGRSERSEELLSGVLSQSPAIPETEVDLLKVPSWKSHQEWVKWMLAGLFAAVVIGYGGQVLGLRAPVALVFGLILLRLTLSNRVEDDSNCIDAENGGSSEERPLIVSHRGELLHRALALVNVEQQLAKGLSLFTSGEMPETDYKVKRDSLALEAKSLLLGQTTAGTRAATLKLRKGDQPGELALAVGPYVSWWQNGMLAVRLGSWLAVVPIVYFAYVFLSSQGPGAWSLGTPFAMTGLVTALTYEVAFWLVAAFALGCLFHYLPGRNGPVKGAVLAAIYVGANAAAALLGITGNALWQVRSFQLLLFLMLLGAWLDLKTIEAEGLHRRDLIALYDLPNTSNLVSQVLPLVTALGVVVAQLLLGQTQAATESLVTGDAGQQILSFFQRVR